MTQIPNGPNDYPWHSVDVTADRIARHLTAVANRHDAEGQALLDADPHSTEGKLYRAVTAAYVNEFTVVYLLRHVARRDVRLADELARAVWECWNDGGTMHELLWEWARDYGQHDTAPAEAGTT
jgi:hypothetical protein